MFPLLIVLFTVGKFLHPHKRLFLTYFHKLLLLPESVSVTHCYKYECQFLGPLIRGLEKTQSLGVRSGC